MSTQYIRYPSSVNASNAVLSFDGRTGNVVPLASDYAAFYLELDGSNGPMTGFFDLVGDAINPLNAVTFQQLQAAQFGTVPKGSVFAATTSGDGNKALTGAVTADGQVVPNGQNVLLQFQTDARQNGIWVVNTGGAWSRPANFANGANGFGAYVSVVNGATFGDTFRIQINDPCIVGTDNELWNFQAQSVYTADGLTLQLIGNQFSIKNGGVSDAQLSSSINVVTTGVGSFAHLSITGTGTNGWINLQGQTSPPANALAAGDIRFYANTAGFGGVGFKTFGGQALEFNIDQVNTQYAKVIVQDQASIIMANVPTPVTSGDIVTTDGVTLSSVPASGFLTGIVDYAHGGTNTNTSFTQGSVIFAGPTSFAQDNANFFWDDTNNRLGLNTAAAPRTSLMLGAFPAVTAYASDIALDGLTLRSTSALHLTAVLESNIARGALSGASLALSSRDGVGAMTAGARLGAISFFGSGDAGTNQQEGARIQAVSAGGWSFGLARPTSLGFFTATGNSLAQKMTLFNNGALNVGLGNANAIANTTTVIQPLALASVGLLVRGITGQTADLQQWQNVTPTTLGRMTAAGSMQAIDFTALGTAGAGFLDLPPQSVQPSANISATGVRVFCNVNNRFGWVDSTTGFSATFLTSGFSANRIYILPNQNCTLANVPAPGLVVSTGGLLTTGQASLTTDVTGILPIANGGTAISSISNNQIFFANAGVFAQSANFTFTTGTNTLALTGTLNVTGNATVQDLNVRHILATGAAPTAVRGTGAGNTGTILVQGHDTAGSVTVQTSGGGTATNATIFTLTFNVAFVGTQPRVVFSPRNRLTAGLSAAQAVFCTPTLVGFIFTSGTTALANNQTYQWDYHVIQ